MTAGGSTQIFALCWAPLSSVHIPTVSFLFHSCLVLFSKWILCVHVWRKFWHLVSLTGSLDRTNLKSYCVIVSSVGTSGPGCLLLISWRHWGRCSSASSCPHTLFLCIPGSSFSVLNPVRCSAGRQWKGLFLFLFPTCLLPASWHHLFLKQIPQSTWRRSVHSQAMLTRWKRVAKFYTSVDNDCGIITLRLL